MSDMTKEFRDRLEMFVAGCERIASDNIKTRFRTLEPPVFYYTVGRKYVRVVKRHRDMDSGGSAHCFVDLENGDVLLPASWRSPAKHARGNIFDDSNGLGNMGPYGPAYLR